MLPMLILASIAIDRLPGRALALLAVSLLVAVNVAVLSLGGSWGQSMKMTGELMVMMKDSPDAVFVADDMTVREMLVINEFRRPDNLYMTPVPTDLPYIPVPSVSERELRSRNVFLLVNQLNLERCDGTSQQWISARCGDLVQCTQPQYRIITYLLPETYRTSHAWTLRRPAAEVRRVAEGRSSQDRASP